MSKVKLNLKDKSVPQKVQFMQQIIEAMTGNANFPNPSPKLTDVTKGMDALSGSYTDAQAARLTSVQKTDALNLVDADTDAMLNLLASYVENASGGDAAIIQSAGMQVRSQAEPVGPLPAPENLRPLEGDMPGEVALLWNPVPSAKSYTLQQTQNITVPASWVNVLNCTKGKLSVSGLVVGQRYWFRVAAVGSAGQGPFGEPASRIVS